MNNNTPSLADALGLTAEHIKISSEALRKALEALNETIGNPALDE